MSDNCLFCRIVAGGVPAHVVCESEHFVAFLDIHPIRPGHTQIVARAHVPYFESLPADAAAAIVTTGQKLATIMKKIYGVPRVAFFFTGGDIAHAHAHVVPMHEKTDVTSRRYIAEEPVTFRPTPRMPDEELKACAGLLRRELAAV